MKTNFSYKGVMAWAEIEFDFIPDPTGHPMYVPWHEGGEDWIVGAAGVLHVGAGMDIRVPKLRTRTIPTPVVLSKNHATAVTSLRCGECNGKGRIELFVSQETCRRCDGRGSL